MSALTETLRPGCVLVGRYRVDHAIARGGYGIVYAGHQLDVDRPVVIKTLVPHVQIDEGAVERFEREARLVAGLRHPNTVTVFEFGSTPEGVFYLVMERIFGEPLSTVLRQRGALPAAMVRSILTQLLESLAEAHALGIIHRDIKPSNIMLCEIHGRRDFIKLLDFGIAKAIGADGQEGEPTLTGTGQFIGTPGYMAPEMIIGDPVDVHSDLYSVGLVGYELLTGQKAFQARSPLEKISVQATTDPPAPPPHVAAEPIWGVIAHLIERAPHQRPQSAEDALAALHALDSASSRPAMSAGPATVMVRPPAATTSMATAPGTQTHHDASPTPSPWSQTGRHGEPGAGSPPSMSSPMAFGPPPPQRGALRGWQIALLGAAVAVFVAGVALLIYRLAADDDAGDAVAADAGEITDSRITAAPIVVEERPVTSPVEPPVEVDDDTLAITDDPVDVAEIEPEPQPVAVVIVTDPAGATVRHDGEALGETPLNWEVLPDDAEAELELALDGYEVRTVNVSRASAGRYEYALERKRRRRSSRRDDDDSGRGKKDDDGGSTGETPRGLGTMN